MSEIIKCPKCNKENIEFITENEVWRKSKSITKPSSSVTCTENGAYTITLQHLYCVECGNVFHHVPKQQVSEYKANLEFITGKYNINDMD